MSYHPSGGHDGPDTPQPRPTESGQAPDPANVSGTPLSSQAAKPSVPAVPVDPTKWVRDHVFAWVVSKFGRIGLWLLAIAVGAGSIWWNWDHIETLPFVSQALERMTLKRVPHVSEDGFTIAVVHFEDDPGDENEKLLIAELDKFRGLTVLPIDRLIKLPSGETQTDSIARGHQEARVLLKQSGAQALILGKRAQAR